MYIVNKLHYWDDLNLNICEVFMQYFWGMIYFYNFHQYHQKGKRRQDILVVLQGLIKPITQVIEYISISLSDKLHTRNSSKTWSYCTW